MSNLLSQIRSRDKVAVFGKFVVNFDSAAYDVGTLVWQGRDAILKIKKHKLIKEIKMVIHKVPFGHLSLFPLHHILKIK